jgi:hypothetical protein
LGNVAYSSEWRFQFQPYLEQLARQVEEIENVVSGKYGFSALKLYREARYQYADTVAGRETLRKYWEESALEYLSALGNPVDSLRRRLPPGAYRSTFLDTLAGTRSGKFSEGSPQLEPSLAQSDIRFGTDAQVTYDCIRVAWEARAGEAKHFLVGGSAALDERESRLGERLAELMDRLGRDSGFAMDARSKKKNPIARYRLGRGVVDLCLGNGPSRRLKDRQLDMVAFIVGKAQKVDLTAPGYEGGYIPLNLSVLFPGFLHAYGNFRSDQELVLCVSAATSVASELFDRLLALMPDE